MSTSDSLQEKLRAQIDQADAELKKYEAKFREKKAEADLQSDWDDLKQHRDQASKRLEELRDSAGDASEDIQSGASQAWEKLSEAMTNARRRFS